MITEYPISLCIVVYQLLISAICMSCINIIPENSKRIHGNDNLRLYPLRKLLRNLCFFVDDIHNVLKVKNVLKLFYASTEEAFVIAFSVILPQALTKDLEKLRKRLRIKLVDMYVITVCTHKPKILILWHYGLN